jgi:hypothetical protein
MLLCGSIEVLLAAHPHSAQGAVMTALRQRMTEDMQVRNLALNTQTTYIQQVSLFARHFKKSPDQLGPTKSEPIRSISPTSGSRRLALFSSPWPL